ncbi:hypothetical protein THASP1DRAFT_32247 [Thamnocephalis sphaerospora]|uniref:GAT domain-containing protein n=1 Tax=Thamnocephalis sphaerospora TaxID=78915 RepID=A0A4P9XJJ1_9FUNG|nr:hypothetical protein THASP1DRAFT_32247 [Thamnocephalis sphaerospora]|eukprot:RKP05925.1 hypothetical protein THASP1DRAFT_32247 [Thamnocephalis sphaerospora]
MSPEDYNREVTRLVEVASNSVQMLSEALVYADPDNEDIRQNELISEFHQKCTNLNSEIVRFLSTVQDEELIGMLIKTNQELVDVFKQYDDIVECHQVAQATARSTQETRNATGTHSDLLGFDGGASSSSANNTAWEAPASMSPKSMGKQPEQEAEYRPVEPYAVAPPPQPYNPFDDVFATLNTPSAPQLSPPLVPMSMPVPQLPAPLVPMTMSPPPQQQQQPANGHQAASVPAPMPAPYRAPYPAAYPDPVATIVTQDEHGNRHAIV